MRGVLRRAFAEEEGRLGDEQQAEQRNQAAAELAPAQLLRVRARAMPRARARVSPKPNLKQSAELAPAQLLRNPKPKPKPKPKP